MSQFDIHEAIKDIFGQSYGKPVPDKPRFQKQRDIEDAIKALCPDFIEAKEIMDAIMASLGRRYEQDITDVDNAYADLKDSLLEADATEQKEHDEYTNRMRQMSEKGE